MVVSASPLSLLQSGYCRSRDFVDTRGFGSDVPYTRTLDRTRCRLSFTTMARRAARSRHATHTPRGTPERHTREATALFFALSLNIFEAAGRLRVWFFGLISKPSGLCPLFVQLSKARLR